MTQDVITDQIDSVTGFPKKQLSTGQAAHVRVGTISTDAAEDIAAAISAASSEVHIGEVGLKIATPTSTTLTRPNDTTAYAVGDLVADNTTAGSVAVKSFTASRIATGNGYIDRARLITNKTSGMAAIGMSIRFWSAAPTYTNGDNGAYAVATGNASFLGKMTVTAFEQNADGAVAIATSDTGRGINFSLASGSTIYWDLQINSVLTPAANQTFILIPEIYQN